ncbi:MAG: hypothetical protein J6V01_04940, partial [Clostridia bacterium]|nr:hypothetical protein [Clostridia bacterium]
TDWREIFVPVLTEKSQENRRFFKILTSKQAQKEPSRRVRRIVRYCLKLELFFERIKIWQQNIVQSKRKRKKSVMKCMIFGKP